LGDYPRALEMLSKSLQFAKIENNLSTIGVLYLNIGNVFDHRGESKKALDYYSRGIKHLENDGNMVEVARGHFYIGDSHMQIGHIEQAEAAYDIALEKAKEKGKQDYWGPNISMINIHGLQGRYEDAKDLFNICHEAMKEKDDKIGLGLSHMYYGNIRSLEQNFDEAEILLIRSITMFENLGLIYELGRAKFLLGENYIRAQRFEEAKNFLDESYQIFKNLGAKSQADITRLKLLELRDDGGI
jgi:tetratricopeptide (TPR) repeat protein